MESPTGSGSLSQYRSKTGAAPLLFTTLATYSEADESTRLAASAFAIYKLRALGQ